MTSTKSLNGECQHCGGHLKFPADSIGLTAPCPHCAKDTELMLATPPLEPTVPRKVIVWTLVTIVILVAGFSVLLAGLNHFEKEAARKKQKADATPYQATNTPAEITPRPATR
ncbi:MAG: hypothetical protein WCT12_24220 [Verrucomicrobiota bacterium]